MAKYKCVCIFIYLRASTRMWHAIQWCHSDSASPNRYEEDWSTVATFQGPITHSSESTVTSASAQSAGLVASVPWPALRFPCSIAGKYQEPRSHTCASDGSSATWPCVLWHRLSTVGRQAFTVQGPMFWNSLPDDLSAQSFRQHLKTRLFSSY